MREAHAVVIAVISGLVFFVVSLVGPWLVQAYWPSVAFPTLGFLGALCGVVIIVLIGLFIGGYLAWEQEERERLKLERRLAPRLRLECDPGSANFVWPTPTQAGFKMVYLRVLARAMSQTVKKCQAFLQRVSQWDGNNYVSLYDVPIELPWSERNPLAIEPQDLNHDVGMFVDVAWFADPASGLPPFGLANIKTVHALRLLSILNEQILPFPERNLKLDLLLIGVGSENATLSLNIHRSRDPSRWNKPQIGWMSGREIRIDSYVSDEVVAVGLLAS